MYVVFTISLIALLLTYLDSRNQMRNGMLCGFVLLTLLGAIHYNYGNDYMVYHNLYKEILNYQFNFESIIREDFFKEPGWVFLCYFFDKLGGFFVMVAILNIIQNTIVYRFIKSNVDRKWWPLAMFIYTFTTNLYLINFSMMRQGFVVCVFLGLWELINERKWWWPLIILYLCSFIHTSAMILLPFAFWGYLPNLKGKTYAVIFSISVVLLWLSADFLNSLFANFMSFEDFQEYSETYGNDKNTATYGIGFIIKQTTFFVALYYLISNKNADNKQKIVLLSMLSFIIMPFVQIMPLISRVGFYFLIYQLAALPIIYRNIERKDIRLGLLSVYILLTLYDYWIFFNNSIFTKSYRTFHTIFEAI